MCWFNIRKRETLVDTMIRRQSKYIPLYTYLNFSKYIFRVATRPPLLGDIDEGAPPIIKKMTYLQGK